MYSNLIVGGYLWMIVLGIWPQDLLKNLGGKVLVIFDLLKVLMGVKVSLVEIVMLYGYVVWLCVISIGSFAILGSS